MPEPEGMPRAGCARLLSTKPPRARPSALWVLLVGTIRLVGRCGGVRGQW